MARYKTSRRRKARRKRAGARRLAKAGRQKARRAYSNPAAAAVYSANARQQALR